MKSCRIHIMGASGAGATSLGGALADALAIPHHDTDDYFWLPTAPPYRNMRDVAERLKLMLDVFVPRAEWVLSGSLNGWGDVLIPICRARPRRNKARRSRRERGSRRATRPAKDTSNQQ